MKKTTEDYLKTILLLCERESSVRSIALAEAFGVSKPTVCKIVKGLLCEGYITKDGSNEITLTERGEKLANETLKRNLTIQRFFDRFGCGAIRRRSRRLQNGARHQRAELTGDGGAVRKRFTFGSEKCINELSN